MCTTGLKQSSHMKPKIFPGTLCVPLICAIIIIIIYVVFQNDMNTKMKIIYPKKKPLKACLKVCDVPVESGPVIKVGDHKTYVIGSYVEHRSDVKQIKTVAIVLRNEVVDYYCLICCNGRNISVPALYTIHSDHFNFEYGAADIVCDVPKSCTTQLYVAVTAKSNKDSGSLQNIQSFQMVENQKLPKSYPYNFTVCISVMYDYDNVLQLVQAMEMFKILGVQRVAVYKTNCSSTAQKILDYYVKTDFVEIIPWIVPSYIRVSRGWQKSVSPGELHYFGQIAALNDCVYRYMYRSNYVALHDLDELILPMKLTNWTALMDHLEKNYGYNMGFEFENVLFAASLKQQKPEYSPDLWKKISGVNILEHVIGLKNDPTKFNNIKVIVNPRLVFKATVHGLLEILGGSVRVSPEVAHMYHVKHVPEELLSEDLLITDTHLWDYAERLVPVVSEVLQQALNIH